jgi:hypothetical protein
LLGVEVASIEKAVVDALGVDVQTFEDERLPMVEFRGVLN